MGWGSEMRWPSRKMLKVFAFALPGSKFRTTPMTWSLWNFCPAGVFFLPDQKEPSESKKTCSSLSPRTKGDAAAEKPMRKSCLGIGTRDRAPAEASAGLRVSTILTSNIYLPAFIPTFARAPAMRYCMPPSVNDIKTLPPMVEMTLSVVSEGWNPTTSFRVARLSSGASVSTSGLLSASFFTAALAFGSILASFFAGSSAFSSAFRFSTSGAAFGADITFAAAFITVGSSF
mmetsp:Transcript_12280/g.30969  ORF Transcript_12280/g.30969 Transcript_12280/m.30969 type:complete len:231 (+) Transcript_12280:2088-2780(+)